MTTARVSVVIPTHNRADRLEAAVATVRAQSLAPAEIVIVDDGSSDRTPALTARLAAGDDRVRVIRLPTAHGAPGARNAGVAAARGELVAFLDDDDAWAPGKLARQVAYLVGDEGLVGVGCHFAIEGPDGVSVHRGPVRYGRRELQWANFLGSTSLLMAWSTALGPEPFDVSLTNYEDWDLYLRLAGKGGLATVPEVLCTYRDHGAPRLTTDRAKRVNGYRALVDRYATDMSPTCMAYHRAKIRLLAAPRPTEKALAVGHVVLAGRPSAAAMALTDPVAAWWGRRRSDPALALRRIHRRAVSAGRARASV